MSIWLIFILCVTVFGIWFMLNLRNPDELAAFKERIQTLGAAGWFVLLGIQYVQIIAAFIPGSPIQIAAGSLYGVTGGLSVILGGLLFANITIFALVRRYGQRVLSLLVDDGDISRYKFISSPNKTKLSLLVVVLYFIIGIPKDALTYIFALTPIKFWRFMILSTIARLPGILVSLLAGDSIIQGEYIMASVFFGTLVLLALIGMFLKDKFRKSGRDV